MPVVKVNFGKPYQSFSDEQYRDGIVQSLKDGFVDIDNSFVKRPGLTTFATTPGSGTTLGLYETGSDALLASTNGKIYNISSAGSATEITGTGLTSGYRVTFTEDRTNIFFAHAGGYLCKVASGMNSFSAMTATGSPISSTHIVYQQGHLLCNPGATTTAGTASVLPGDVSFNNLAGYPGSGWRVYNNESNADSCSALLKLWDEIYAPGPRTIETSWNDGSTPWAKSNAPTLTYGTPSPYSMLVTKDTIYWLSFLDNAYRVVQLQGRRGVDISDPCAVMLQDFTSFSDVFGMLLSIEGAQFYLLTSPTDGKTLAYSTASRTWSEWGSWSGTAYGRYLPNCAVSWRSQRITLLGTSEATGKIYKLLGTSDDGGAIRFELTSGNQSFGSDRKKVYDSALIKWRSTNANNTFRIQWRDNGGAWSSELTVGPQGYTRDTYFSRINRLGGSRERQWRIIHDDTNYPFTFVSMEVSYRDTGV